MFIFPTELPLAPMQKSALFPLQPLHRSFKKNIVKDEAPLSVMKIQQCV